MPSDISASVSETLSGKTIVVGVTGSIAAVRVIDLIRDLIRRGAEVHCTMSHAAGQILHPYALEYASNHPVITEITGRVEHVLFCGVGGKADLFLVAPATANTIGKMANGIDDTPVTTFATTALGSGKPVAVVPAMHEAMYRHPAVIRNLQILREMGVALIDPRIEEGKAKFADNQRVVQEVERLLGPADLKGKRILITSGSNAESIDPIRILTNRASGKTGVALALEARRRGADVTLVHRFIQDLPVHQVYAQSASDMLDAVMSELKKGCDALISAAAVADYTLDPSEEKIKSGLELNLRLKPTRKIIKTVREAYPDLKIVGFKAETDTGDEALLARARASLEGAGLDLVVANDVSRGGMGTDDNRVLILSRSGSHSEVEGKKSLIARRIIDSLAEIL
ncbi:bifunctional phosphopantothenoylcysteine decarboxylase/phosphopantothenate--cysteine ligase CoaBC [Methanothrix soehngenii]|uniref:Coenzyme A biosynthesis bifunctional protein CoaBC n=1 Tax=Methanothrix soehngenii (strain ATCC 5969 / DSM 3671 / JCM 10134 / NBRC 103675 / OCM 69 / GP-6) TaxID=990316 RepID=F4BW95_METSG|nr:MULTISPECIES: bifunctional phosphopantothenoylcysteine decarboxylase/phosphopantothenate--cysteine ligase CoaBC [Methanothrix]AEB69705.1 phosphopantothenoylcysteine decarboxylase/phosphopantothenate--cysteine ligase [Methanothrix soehngenii GP6]HNQ52118.1 bifunctional phosphopantothenoylcysteine decarboxylase/phosphopantothenate--cysteine ligase CoaBC [Methanothrix soehngenii]